VAAEAALVLPPCLLLLVITVDFSRLFYYHVTITNCARNGALYLSDPAGISYSRYQNVQEAALADAGNLSPQPTVSSTLLNDASGNRSVAVTVSYPFSMVTSFLGFHTVHLSRTVQMRVSSAFPG
jgi:Flp pilus assembly protein TadG